MKTATAPKTQTDPSNWWHYSANQWWGCEKISPACKFCYAETFDKYAGRNLDPAKQLHWGPGVPRLFVQGFAAKMRRMNAVFAANPSLGRPRVFCDSMCDWLDPAVRTEWLWSLIETIKDCKAMDFLLLTKRPEAFEYRLVAMAEQVPASRRSVEWWLGGGQPDNVWAGATVEAPEYRSRIGSLLKIGARIHWLSCEPLLGNVDLRGNTESGIRMIGGQRGCSGAHQHGGKPGQEIHGVVHHQDPTQLHHHHDERCRKGIDWVVIGGESGKHARPSHPLHIQSLIMQCREARVPVWFKQWGEWVGGRYDGRKSKVMLEDGRIYWPQSKAELNNLRFWGEMDGVFKIISARVGMNPKPILKMGSGPEEFTNNHLYQNRIIRELPVKTEDFKTKGSR